MEAVLLLQPTLVYTGQSPPQPQATPAGLGYLVLQLLDPHLEEDAYPGDSGPVMLQVHGPDVLTELLDERHNFITVELRADHLGPEPDGIPGFLPPLLCPRRLTSFPRLPECTQPLSPLMAASHSACISYKSFLSSQCCLALSGHWYQEGCFCPQGRNDFTSHAFEA